MLVNFESSVTIMCWSCVYFVLLVLARCPTIMVGPNLVNNLCTLALNQGEE